MGQRRWVGKIPECLWDNQRIHLPLNSHKMVIDIDILYIYYLLLFVMSTFSSNCSLKYCCVVYYVLLYHTIVLIQFKLNKNVLIDFLHLKITCIFERCYQPNIFGIFILMRYILQDITLLQPSNKCLASCQDVLRTILYIKLYRKSNII